MRILLVLVVASLTGACAEDAPLVTVEANLTLNGTAATCADLGVDRIRVRFTERTDDGSGDVRRLDVACGETMPSLAMEPGGWTVAAELSHVDGIHRHALPQRWLLVGDSVDETLVPLAFEYGTFALRWSLAVDGAPASCVDLGSDEVTVEYTSHEGTRVQRLPCIAGAATSVPMPRSKTYSVHAELTHPSQVYPTSSQTRRMVEPRAPTPVAIDFSLTAAQAPRR